MPGVEGDALTDTETTRFRAAVTTLSRMRHLVDPAIVPGLAGWAFLALMLAVLPAGAVAQDRALRRDPARAATLDRRSIYTGAVITHLVIFGAALLAVRGLHVIPMQPLRPLDLAAGAVALAIGLVPVFVDLWTDPAARERAALIAPRTRGEFIGFGGVALSAGIAEEIAYRCVLFALLVGVTNSWAAAALIGAAAFGVAHVFQGWRSAFLAGVIALVAQATLIVTANVVVIVAIHVIHDLIAAFVVSRRERAAGSTVAV